MMEWLKKYSIQVALASVVVGSTLAAVTSAGVEIPQWALVALLILNGVLSGFARVIPQGGK